MKQQNIEKNRLIIKTVENWSVDKINNSWEIIDVIENNDVELLEKAARDIIASNQINRLLTFPNYARLMVIGYLNWYEQLSMENIFFIEEQLYQTRDDYRLDDMDFKEVLRAIKRH